MASLTENPNAPNNDGDTPIWLAAHNGHTEIVKILAPLTENPNAPDVYGHTPMHWATLKGYTEITKILAPFTDKLNAPTKNLNVLDKNEETQIDVTKNAKMSTTLDSFKTSTKRNAGRSPTQSQKKAKKS